MRSRCVTKRAGIRHFFVFARIHKLAATSPLCRQVAALGKEVEDAAVQSQVLDSLQDLNTSLSEQLQRSQAQLDERALVQVEQARYKVLQEEALETLEALGSLQADLSAAKGKVTELERCLHASTVELEEAMQHLGEARLSCTAMTGQLTTLSDERRQYQDAATQLEMQLQQSVTELEQARQACQQSAAEVVALGGICPWTPALKISAVTCPSACGALMASLTSLPSPTFRCICPA